MTPEQQRKLDRMDRAPWKWFISDARYWALRDQWEREAQEREAQERVDEQRAYFTTLSRVTGYTGPDYRVRFPDQASWVRANQWQYEQAGRDGIARAIWSEPETAAA